MRRIARAILGACLLASVSTVVSPLQADLPTPPKSDCCKKAEAAMADKDCSHGQKPPQDLQCCASCPICLLAVLNVPTKISPPSYCEQLFAEFSENGATRAQRPPVPPPRLSSV